MHEKSKMLVQNRGKELVEIFLVEGSMVGRTAVQRHKELESSSWLLRVWSWDFAIALRRAPGLVSLWEDH